MLNFLDEITFASQSDFLVQFGDLKTEKQVKKKGKKIDIGSQNFSETQPLNTFTAPVINSR